MSRLYLLAPRRDLFRRTARIKGMASANLIGYWPLAEAGGTVAIDESGNGRNGAYTAVTLAQPGTGDGRTSASFDGSTSYGNIYTASLAAAFNGAEGTLAAWARVAGSGVWTDGTTRRVAILQADANNRILLTRTTTNNTLTFGYVAGSTNSGFNSTAAGGLTGWIHLAVTWSKSADEFKGYLNGSQVGSTATGLGVFAGALANTAVVMGASTTTPANVWSGNIAHVALWTAPLSATQIAVLAGG